jgi:hypothetical protein
MNDERLVSREFWSYKMLKAYKIKNFILTNMDGINIKHRVS